MDGLRIFLSHSHKDNDWCSAFVEELKRYGADIWYDKQGLYVGAKWRQMIETELEGRDIFLVVLTPNSWASAWVQDELTLAMSHQKRIVSVLHQPTEIKGFITTRQMLKVVSLSSIEAAKSVAASLGLSHSEQPVAPTNISVEKPLDQSPPIDQSSSTPAPKPSPSKEVQSADEEYEYFEITVRRYIDNEYGYLLTNIDSGQVFHRLSWWDARWGNPNEHSRYDQKRIDEVKKLAKAKGLEELPEKGAEWYSYRFRRKKQ